MLASHDHTWPSVAEYNASRRQRQLRPTGCSDDHLPINRWRPDDDHDHNDNNNNNNNSNIPARRM